MRAVISRWLRTAGVLPLMGVLALVWAALAGVLDSAMKVVTWLGSAGARLVVLGLGVHWTTDVLASIVFAAGWLAAIAVLSRGRPSP